MKTKLNNFNCEQRNDQQKKRYDTPQVELYGKVAEVTKGPDPGTFDAIIFAPGGIQTVS